MKVFFLINTTKKWLAIIGATAVAGIGLSIILIRYGNEIHLIHGAILTALLTGISSIFFILSKQTQYLSKQSKRLSNEIKDNTTEIRASHSLHSIIKTKLPLNLGGWAVDAHFLHVVVKEILLREPKLIVECGSGTSTIVSAYCLQQVGSGRVLSLDHSDDYARATRNLLKYEGLEHRSEVVYAPLKEQLIEDERYRWYNPDFISRLDGKKIDMLIIDGPPESVQELSRYPAVPILRDFLSEDCIILMDDGNRRDETLISQKWAEQLNAELTYVKDCKGYRILKKSRKDKIKIITPSSTSIIIPVYNNIARLEKSLKSLTVQTIPREDYEIIVVDNGSTDGSYQVAKRYADQVLIQDKMKSPYPSRNMGVRASKGYYKILVDSNITVPEHFLEAGIQQLEEYNSDFGAPLIKFELDENSTTWELLDSLVYVNIEGEIKSGSVTGGCVFTKNDFFNRFGYFDESLRSTGDTLWSQKATSMGAKLVLLEKLEVNYPPKDRHLLLKKARRIGAGNRSVWHQEELPPFRMFLKAIRSMQPLSFSALRRIIEKRGRNDIVYPHLKLWFYNWIRNINTGIGRLGF